MVSNLYDKKHYIFPSLQPDLIGDASMSSVNAKFCNTAHRHLKLMHKNPNPNSSDSTLHSLFHAPLAPCRFHEVPSQVAWSGWWSGASALPSSHALSIVFFAAMASFLLSTGPLIEAANASSNSSDQIIQQLFSLFQVVPVSVANSFCEVSVFLLNRQLGFECKTVKVS